MALAAAGLNAWRLSRWHGARTLRLPLLWALHLGYAWLVVGLAVKGAGSLTGLFPAATALHGITIGAIGTMTLAMMTRVTLGHTGRPLEAGPIMAVAYLGPTLAALVRLVTPLAAPGAYAASVTVSSVLWVASFAVFCALFVPLLLRPRGDGTAG